VDWAVRQRGFGESWREGSERWRFRLTRLPVDLRARERKGWMKSKRQTTMAKLARERLVQERRTLKREKKQAAAAERNAEATETDAPTETTD
jgi:hypothetical protein